LPTRSLGATGRHRLLFSFFFATYKASLYMRRLSVLLLPILTATATPEHRFCELKEGLSQPIDLSDETSYPFGLAASSKHDAFFVSDTVNSRVLRVTLARWHAGYLVTTVVDAEDPANKGLDSPSNVVVNGDDSIMCE
jgi:hypothetical protein